MLKKLIDLHAMARKHQKKRLVLAAAQDQNAIEAVIDASRNGIIDVILVGNQAKVQEICQTHGYDISAFNMINEPDDNKAAATSVKMVAEGAADILMKGKISSSCLLKAVLNKEWGLRSGELLSHLALFEIATYHKLLALSDAAMNIAPDLNGKISIIRNGVAYLKKLGVQLPKVAVLSAVETVNPDMKSSVEASMLAKMGDRGQITGCLIDGPLAFDNAISSKSALLKNIHSPVAGDADLLICDDLDAANSIYKAIVYFAQAQCAAIIVGATAPIVLTSRSDSHETKLNSIALAAAIN
jgi:phosphate butyryltransferase